MDGSTASTHDDLRGVNGSFERVINGIKICRSLNIPKISCSYTVTSKSIGEIKDTCELLVELGVDAVQFGPLADTGRASDHSELTLSAQIHTKSPKLLENAYNNMGKKSKSTVSTALTTPIYSVRKKGIN